jgi:hypothetical protein
MSVIDEVNPKCCAGHCMEFLLQATCRYGLTSFIASTVIFLLAAAFVMKDTYALRAESAKYVSSSSVKPLEVLRTYQVCTEEERGKERLIYVRCAVRIVNGGKSRCHLGISAPGNGIYPESNLIVQLLCVELAAHHADTTCDSELFGNDLIASHRYVVPS